MKNSNKNHINFSHGRQKTNCLWPITPNIS
ncbi:hypothetical protein RDI58_027392 [Solanum bulbocastanum]|uniref:Uncharacterized protein n=1 Tax=Solanum bulbocastanum TaxID=147425 RepID=A0AAN8T3A0_SOLBU